MVSNNLIREGSAMNISSIRTFIALAILLYSGYAWAQGKVEQEIEIHKNIKLVELEAESDLSQDFIKQYKEFLPRFEELLKKATADQSDECALTLRISAGVKAVGAAKINRPTAHVTAFRKNSKEEFVGVLILYSYASSGPLDENEMLQFLQKQILEPSECHTTQ
jgi:hypothetical protein